MSTIEIASKVAELRELKRMAEDLNAEIQTKRKISVAGRCVNILRFLRCKKNAPTVFGRSVDTISDLK